MLYNDFQIRLYMDWVEYLKSGQIYPMSFKEYIEDFIQKAEKLKNEVNI